MKMIPGVVTRFFIEVEILDEDGSLVVTASAELNRADPITISKQWWGSVGANLRPFVGQHLRIRTPEGREGDFVVKASTPAEADVVGFGDPPL
ncbi:MAG: hypothetical protein WD651_06725 [Acidimicrobiia bacterium]